MNIRAFPKHLFWSYDPNADLPVETVAEQVILYGDLDDLFRLSDLVPAEVIVSAKNKIAARGHWLRRCYFVEKIILGP